MTVPVRLAAFAVAIVLATGAGALLGAAVGSSVGYTPEPSTGHGSMPGAPGRAAGGGG